MNNPTLRIRLIERSMRCYVFGVVGLIPLIGLGPSLLAIWLYASVWSESKEDWNPAKRYLTLGFCLGWSGVLISTLTVVLFILWLINHFGF